jgi:cytoskeletal protein RodZ
MKTLGQILKERREKRNITLGQAEDATKVRKVYLQGLEEGDYTQFPATNSLKGFLKIYSEYLGFTDNEIMPFFRREFDESKDGELVPKTPTPMVKEPLIRFTPQIFFTGLFVSAIAILFAYVWVQYQAFAGAPTLEIFSPRDGLVVNEVGLDIEGKVSVNSTLSLNGQPVKLAQDGYFKENIQLSEGPNYLTFVAVNEVGKSTTLKRAVRYDVK